MFQNIKHIAFASNNANKAMTILQDLFGEAQNGQVKDVPAAHYRVAKFTLGGVEMQFCEPMAGDVRFSTYLDLYGPGLHHICFVVEKIDDVVAQVEAKGATLQACPSCSVTGSHIHPEGWIAFFSTDTLPEMQIEVMQVYGPGEKEKYWGDRAEV